MAPKDILNQDVFDCFDTSKNTIPVFLDNKNQPIYINHFFYLDRRKL
jgi:hypothetical protein